MEGSVEDEDAETNSRYFGIFHQTRPAACHDERLLMSHAMPAGDRQIPFPSPHRSIAVN